MEVCNAFRNMKLSQYCRPIQRLFTGKLRLYSLVVLLICVLIYVTKLLKAPLSGVTDYKNVYEYAENARKLQDDLNYAVIVDAGSSGSRAHIYCWPPHSGDSRRLLSVRMLKNNFGRDISRRITPGLSSRASNTSSAFDYLQPLLMFAASHIPEKKHTEAPLFILATAGMRLIPQKIQDEILDNLRTNIPKRFDFIFSKNHVEVITGKEEGIYSWISVNYLLGRFDHSINSKNLVAINRGNGITIRPKSLGILEMGGASVQAAFEIVSKYEVAELMQRRGVKSQSEMKDVLVEFDLGCQSHDTNHLYLLYVRTYLGIGANVALETYTNHLFYENLPPVENLGNISISHNPGIISDPCMVKDSIRNATITLQEKQLHNFVLRGSGQFSVCEDKLSQLLNPETEKGKKCSPDNQCPLKGLEMTKISYTDSEFYGFSELWYTMEHVFRLGGKYDYFDVKKSASEFCGTDWHVIQDRYERKLYPLADEQRLLTQCFKTAWITTLLHKGFKMPKGYNNYRSALTIKGNEVQWTLGALLYRTRFFPLRAVEQHLHVSSKSQPNNSYQTTSFTSYYLNHILFLLCMVAVIAFIIIYLRHLHQMVNNQNPFVDDADLISVKVQSEPLMRML